MTATVIDFATERRRRQPELVFDAEAGINQQAFDTIAALFSDTRPGTPRPGDMVEVIATGNAGRLISIVDGAAIIDVLVGPAAGTRFGALVGRLAIIHRAPRA